MYRYIKAINFIVRLKNPYSLMDKGFEFLSE